MSSTRTMLSILSCVALLGAVGCTKSEETDDTQASTVSNPEKPSTPAATTDAPKDPPVAMTATGAGANQESPTATGRPGQNLDLSSVKAVDPTSTPTKGTPTDSTKGTPLPVSEEIVVTVEPMELDLGRLAVNTTGKGAVVLTNTGDKPMRLIDCKPTCGCTTTNCPRGTEIGPGETKTVDVSLKAGAKAGSRLNKQLTIIVEGQPPIPVRLKGETFTFVEFSPDTIDPDTTPDGTFVVRSIDDQPFRITGMSPPFIESFDDTPRVEHELQFDWDRWEDLNTPVKFNFQFDHPKCSTMTVQMGAKWRQEAFRKWRDNPARNKFPEGTQADFMELVRAGNIEGVKGYISEGGSMNRTDTKTGATALIVAAQSGQVDMARYLLNSKQVVDAVDLTGRTALSYASQKGHADIVALLVERDADPTRPDAKTAVTPISWASGFGNANTVKVLLDAGVDIESKNVAGMTPLMWAAGFGDAARVSMLVDAGSDLTARDHVGQTTPLIYAARNGKSENVQALLQASQDSVNLVDSRKRTALSWAVTALENPVDKVRLLIDAGADASLADADGLTPADYARTRLDASSQEVLKLLGAE